MLPSLPRSPLFSPLLVTIRCNVVAGSMTPWAKAASPLVAPGGCRRRARARAAARATCRGQGRSAALSPRPAQVPGARAGRGVRDPGPGGRPCLPKPTFTPGTAAGAFRLPHERLIFVGVAASLWLPQDLVFSPLQTCPFPSRFAGRRLRRRRCAESWKPESITGRSPWPLSCAELGGGGGGWLVEPGRKLDGEPKL